MSKPDCPHIQNNISIHIIVAGLFQSQVTLLAEEIKHVDLPERARTGLT